MLTARRNRSSIAALLRADEEDLVVVLLAGVADQLVFFQRQRQRLLAEDVLAGLQGLDGDLHVPVVGRDDAHHVDVLALEHLAVVAVGVGLALADVRIVLRLLGMFGVDVADGHDVAEPRVSRASPCPMLPTPMQPITGRSLAELLANADRLQLK